MNPFDDDSGEVYVLVDEQGRHSLWPTFCAVPAGWAITFGPGTRSDALAHVEANWHDIVPRGHP